MLPVALGRTGELYTQHRLLRQLQSGEFALQSLYDQLSSGRRIDRPSEDPLAASQAIGLQRAIERATQTQRNAQTAASFYAQADAASAELGDVLTRARSLAVQGVENTLDETTRQSLRLELDTLVDQLLLASGREFRDQPVLGDGHGVTPLQPVGAAIRFQGPRALRPIPIDPGGPTMFAASLSEALGVGGVAVVGLSLHPQVDTDTLVRNLLSGNAPPPGVVQLTGEGGVPVAIDLTAARSVGELLSLFDRASIDGRAITATLVGQSIEIRYADGQPGTLAIRDLEGSWAKHLGLERPLGSASPIQSNETTPAVDLDTVIALLRGGVGLDVSNGFQIRQGNQTFVVDTAEVQTVSDLLIAINRSGAAVWAELSGDRQSIQVRNMLSGVDLSIGENGGTMASELGLRTATPETRLSELQRARGFLSVAGPELAIVRPDGVRIEVDVDDPTMTIGELLNRINGATANSGPDPLVARLTRFGNGIELDVPSGAEPLRVIALNGSDLAQALGLLPPGQQESSLSGQGGSRTVWRGNDYAPREPSDAVDTLLRLRDALSRGDSLSIERLSSRLDQDLDRLNLARGRIGIDAQASSRLQQYASDRNVELQEQLSQAVDADLAATISALQLRETTNEATLRLLGEVSKLSLLNFL